MATILSQQMGCTIKSDKYKSVEEFLKQLPGAEEFAKEKALAERKKKDAYAQKYYQEYKKQEQAYHQKGGYALTHLQQNPQHVVTERQKSIRKPGKSSGRAQDGWTPLANREKSARCFERVNGWLVEVSDIMSLKEKSGKQNRFTRDKSAWTNRKNARNDKVKRKYPCVTAPTPSPMSEVEKERRRQEMMERNQREQIEQKKLFQEREILLSRLNGLKMVEEWTTCPQCGCSVKAKKLNRHMKRSHGPKRLIGSNVGPTAISSTKTESGFSCSGFSYIVENGVVVRIGTGSTSSHTIARSSSDSEDTWIGMGHLARDNGRFGSIIGEDYAD